MTEEIKVLENILNEIEEESKLNRRENKETKGYLFGTYKPKDKSILVNSKHELLPARKSSGGIIDDLLNIPRGCVIHNEGREFINKIEGESGGVFYSTEFGEIGGNDSQINTINYRVAPTFQLFDHGGFMTYSPNNGKIRGYDSIGNEIPVETFDNEQKICYSGLNLGEE